MTTVHRGKKVIFFFTDYFFVVTTQLLSLLLCLDSWLAFFLLLKECLFFYALTESVSTTFLKNHTFLSIGVVSSKDLCPFSLLLLE